MSIKDKLIFCGNSSIDHIITHRGTKDVIGGSAVNAAIAGSLFGNKEISIISSIGYDFPLDILDKLNINTQYIQQYENKTNSFSIDEINNKEIPQGYNHYVMKYMTIIRKGILWIQF